MAAVFQGIGAAAAALPHTEKFQSQSRRLVSGYPSFDSINWFFHENFPWGSYSLEPNGAFCIFLRFWLSVFVY